MSFISPVQEYLVKDVDIVKKFIDQEIGLECEITTDDYAICGRREGSVVVFGIEDEKEHLAIRKFISSNNLWSE